jgi:Beta-galactosidase/beta-glucuronidase
MKTRLFILVSLLFVVTVSCKKKPYYQSIEIALNENWSFRKAGSVTWMPALVPGNVISDLLKNDKIEDPFFRDNEKKLQWIEKEDWEYRTYFDVPKDVLVSDEIALRFAGLDTYADIYLNNQLVLHTDNMFRSWVLPCKGKLKERNNELRIYFHSPVKAGMQKLKQLSYFLPAPGEQAAEDEKTSVVTRKASFQYGCDFGPRLVSCGIWRPVTLCAWSKAHITDIYLEPKDVTSQLADYNANINIKASKPGMYDISFYIDDQLVDKPYKVYLKKGDNKEVFNFQIPKPNLWWCNGMGPHYMYTLKVKLSQQDQEISGMVQKFGVRKLELVQNADEVGHSFYFRLNGVPVYIKGTTYVPLDAIDLQPGSERYKKLVDDAVGANMNMLRIWGGGIYENDTLYDYCDNNGILIWQDFMFANTWQPNDSLYFENVRQEAAENVKRLRNHPCIALWCGNNEELIAWKRWSWRNQYSKEVAENLWKGYNNLFSNILPDIIHEYDSGVPYKSSSPSNFENELPDKKSGDEHDWRVWSEVAPFTAYYDKPTRFVSSFGMQAFPGMKTFHAFAADSDLDVSSALVGFRQRCNMPWISPGMNGNAMIMNYIQMYYNEPSDFESFVYVSQVMQSEALKTAIETQRINRPICMGSIYWHLNDCWPGISWSTIDYYGRWKPAHYSIKHAYGNALVVPRFNNGNITIYAVNDSVKPLDCQLLLKVVDFNGKQTWNYQDSVYLNPDTCQVLWKGSKDKFFPGFLNIRSCLVVKLVAGERVLAENILYFTDPKYLDLPIPDITYDIKEVDGLFEMLISTDKLAKNVVLDTYEKESRFSENNFDLLPGQKMKLWITYPGTRDDLLNDLKINTLVNSF